MKSDLQPGTEVVINGPNVWGYHIRQGERGVVTTFVFGGVAVRMNRDGKTITWPDESLVPYVDQEANK